MNEIQQFNLEMNNHQQELNNLYNQMMEQEANYQNQLLYKRIENFIWDIFPYFCLLLFIGVIIRYFYDKKQLKKINQEKKS